MKDSPEIDLDWMQNNCNAMIHYRNMLNQDAHESPYPDMLKLISALRKSQERVKELESKGEALKDHVCSLSEQIKDAEEALKFISCEDFPADLAPDAAVPFILRARSYFTKWRKK